MLAVGRLVGPEVPSLAALWPRAGRYLVYFALAVVCLGLTRVTAVERQYFAPSPITGLYPEPGEFADAARHTDGFLVVMALPETAQPALATGGASQPPQAIIEYTVSPGDTVYAIADRLGVSVESIVWANNLTNENYLQPGQVLQVPAVSGVIHTVQPGETLEGIARRYGVDQANILAFAPNGLADPNQLQVGQKLVIPGGRVPEQPRLASARTEPRPAPVQNPPSPPAQAAPAAAAPPAPPPAPPPQPAVRAPSGFGWPTVGPISQYFSAYHRGVDIAPPYGTPVRAAASGVVVQAGGGWNGGYGTMVVIDHGNGYRTLYAHLSRLDVSVGQTVEQGEVIGAVGTTGIVTGPHLHFEVYRGGVPINPLSVLP